MSYSPTNSDATAVANDVVARLNNTSPSSGAQAAGDKLFAIQDSLLCATGFQADSGLLVPATSTTSTTFVDIPSAQLVWTPPISKRYVVHCDFQFFRSAGTGYGQFRIVAGANTGVAWVHVPFQNNTTTPPTHIMEVWSFTAGSPVTIKLQWLASSATTINMTTGGTSGGVRILVQG